jgi:hypothetical protein
MRIITLRKNTLQLADASTDLQPACIVTQPLSDTIHADVNMHGILPDMQSRKRNAARSIA